MRARIVLLVLVIAIMSLAATSPDTREITEPKKISSAEMSGAGAVPIDDLFYTRSTAGGAWSPDGKEIVFSSNFTGRFNLWKVNASGGWPIQLSQSDDRQGGAIWSPDGKWILYQSDRGGAETYDLFAIPSGGGKAENLTKTDEISETAPRWSPDGTQLAMSYKKKSAPVTDVAVMDWKTRAVRNLTKEASADHLWSGQLWAADGKALYATRINAGFTDASVYRIDATTGQKEELTPHKGQSRTNVSAISPDGKTLLVTADRPGGYPNVALLDVGTKTLTWVTDLKWEAEAGEYSPDGKWFTYSVNEDGRTDVYLAETATRNGTKLNLPTGLNGFSGNPSTFSPDGKRMLVSHQSSTQPGDLWIYDAGAKGATQLTFSAIGSLAAAKLPPSQVVHYKSFDGKIISAFLWMPYNLKRDGTNPGIVLPHGGLPGRRWTRLTGSRRRWPRVDMFASHRMCAARPDMAWIFRMRMSRILAGATWRMRSMRRSF